ncbi:MAG: serine/threonine-protein kinase [Myxococcota bacterium]
MTKSVGNWIIGDVIALGSMGAVYHCRNRIVDIHAAFKRIPFQDRSSRDRFRLEVEALFRLGKHPHIVQLLDFGVLADESGGWIVMEFIEGNALPRKLAQEDVVTMLLHIGSALCHAHAHAIYHRDVKPKNILHAGRRGFVLLDFGIARQEDRTRLTEVGGFVGTLEYCPPEHYRPGPEPADDGVGWDVYALGQVAYELLTGTLVPPSREGSRDLAAILMYKQNIPALDPQGTCAPGLADLVRHATEPDPSRRLRSMDELVARANALVPAWVPTNPSLPRLDLRSLAPPEPPVHPLWQTLRGPVGSGLLGCGIVGSATALALIMVAVGVQILSSQWALRNQEKRIVEPAPIVAEAPPAPLAPNAAEVTDIEQGDPEENAPMPTKTNPKAMQEPVEIPVNEKPEPTPPPPPAPVVLDVPLEDVPVEAPEPEPVVEEVPEPEPPAVTLTEVRLAPGHSRGDVELVAGDGTHYAVDPSVEVAPGRYELVVTLGPRTIDNGVVMVGTKPAVVACSLAVICRLKSDY